MAGEPLQGPFDGLTDAERFPARDAGEWLFFVQRASGAGTKARTQSWLQGNGVLGAGRATDAALDARIFLKAQSGSVGIILQRAGWTGADASQAQGTSVRVNLDGTKGRTLGQVDRVGSHLGMRVEMTDSLQCAGTSFAKRQEFGRRPVRSAFEGLQEGEQGVRVGRGGMGRAGSEPESLGNGVHHCHLIVNGTERIRTGRVTDAHDV